MVKKDNRIILNEKKGNVEPRDDRSNVESHFAHAFLVSFDVGLAVGFAVFDYAENGKQKLS